MNTPGQMAYEEDLLRRPKYDNGQARPAWHQLPELYRWTWERKPTARRYCLAMTPTQPGSAGR